MNARVTAIVVWLCSAAAFAQAEWHHSTLYLNGGGYWQRCVAVEVCNESAAARAPVKRVTRRTGKTAYSSPSAGRGY